MILASKNIFNEAKGRFEFGFLEIEKGMIRSVSFGEKSRPQSKSKIQDLGSLFIGPSGIDLHVHSRDFNERHKETFESLNAQAEKGGVAAMACMANTFPRLDTVERLQNFFKLTDKFSTRMIPFGAVTKNLEGQVATDWERLLKLPIAGLSDDGKPILKDEVMRGALRATKKANKLLSLHEEDTTISCASQLHCSHTSTRLGIEGSSDESEVSMVERDLQIAKELKASVHFGHLSSQRTVALLRKARRAGVLFSAEVTPHHALLTVDAAEEFEMTNLSQFKVCPVIREKEDRDSLRKAISEGLIDCFASDHAPHSEIEKNLPIGIAMHGIASMENHFSLYNEVRIQSNLAWGAFFRAFSSRPAELLGLKAGRLAEKFEANFIVFDPQAQISFGFERALSKNSPFVGKRIHGKVVQHYLRGEKVFG